MQIASNYTTQTSLVGGNSSRGNMGRDVLGTKQITDLPTVSAAEARRFFGMGTDRFRTRYRQYLFHEIRSVKTRRGTRYVLADVIQCAFPSADSYAVHKLCLDYLFTNNRGRDKGKGKDAQK